MKFSIVGIIFDGSIDNLVVRFLDIFQEIIRERDQKYITIIVLHEYAFTKHAKEKKEIKLFLEELSNIIKPYNDIILIPGSFAVFKKYPSPPKYNEKISKLKKNYEELSKEKFMSVDEEFKRESDRLDFDLEDAIFLENSTYLITNTIQKKYKKSLPSRERDKLQTFAHQENALFNIGSGRNAKNEFLMNDMPISLGVTICREFYHNAKNDEVLGNAPPMLHLIISDSIRIDEKDNLYGALTIHMDSKRKLSLFLNIAHPESNKITGAQGILYSVTKNHYQKSSVQIKSYDKLITSSPQLK